jgi:dephospho-CoA kinase
VDRLGVSAGSGAQARLRIGLTGGIGSGKSTVARMLVDCGAHLVDTDAIARALTLPGGAAMPALAAHFGAQIVAADGGLDRDVMRQMVFTDAAIKSRLETILHPLIGSEALRQAALKPELPVVFDVPLLAESQGLRPWRARVHRVLVVDCSVETQIARVTTRPGWTEDAARRVIAQQATRAVRRGVADAVIANEGLTLPQLEAEVRALWAWWAAPARLFPTAGAGA